MELLILFEKILVRTRIFINQCISIIVHTKQLIKITNNSQKNQFSHAPITTIN